VTPTCRSWRPPKRTLGAQQRQQGIVLTSVLLLQVENVECLEPSSIKFDFLGKDSVPYENTVEVKPQVFRNVRRWIKKDAAGSSAPSTPDPDPDPDCEPCLASPISVHGRGSIPKVSAYASCCLGA